MAKFSPVCLHLLPRPLRLPRSAFAPPHFAYCARYMSHVVPPDAVVPMVYDLHEPITRGQKNNPIIFLHGLFGSKKNNRGISKALARDLQRCVYALDLRNHGESPHHPRHDYLAMAEDVLAFIRDHKLVKPAIIGHSMGAKAAMTLALRSPESISSLVAVDNAPVNLALSNDFARYIHAMSTIQAANVSRQTEADSILQDVEKSVTIRQFLLGNLRRLDGQQILKFCLPLEVLARSLNELGDFPYTSVDGRCFKGPALFVRGTRSVYVTDGVLPEIEKLFPRYSLIDVDAGHWLISEQPEVFRQAVVDFFKAES